MSIQGQSVTIEPENNIKKIWLDVIKQILPSSCSIDESRVIRKRCTSPNKTRRKEVIFKS